MNAPNKTVLLGRLLLLFYGSIVTPVYEELVFRGYVWNRLPQLAAGELTPVLWKLGAGLGYGVRLSEKADTGQNRQAATAYVHLSTPRVPSLASFTRSKPFQSA